LNNRELEARMASLETQLKELKQTRSEIQSLKQQLNEKTRQITRLEDINDIKRLQCAYGYYLEHWMGPEIMDLFSKRDDVAATLVEGSYFGQEGIRKYFGKSKSQPPQFLHQVMQVSPVITLDQDGEKAWGRWYGYGSVAAPTANGIKPVIMSVTYEMSYIKEAGVWKIWTLALQMHFAYSPAKSWVKPEMIAPENATVANIKLNPDKWAEYEIGYPSGYIYPFHFKHPVTGKTTTEAERNATLNLKPNIYKNW
jgi:hypothetical protein